MLLIGPKVIAAPALKSTTLDFSFSTSAVITVTEARQNKKMKFLFKGMVPGRYNIILINSSSGSFKGSWPTKIRWANATKYKPMAAQTFDEISIIYNGKNYYAKIVRKKINGADFSNDFLTESITSAYTI